MKQIEYEELKKLLEEGKISYNTKTECFVPCFPYNTRYVNVTVKEILDILNKEDLKYALFTIFNESEEE